MTSESPRGKPVGCPTANALQGGPAKPPGRFAVWWMRWRYMWRFAFAHKPLCSRFHQDVLRLGRLYLCRSCTVLYATLLGALIAAAILRPEPLASAVVFGATAVLVVPLSAPRLYLRLPRPVRDLLRAGLGVVLAGWLVLLVQATTQAAPTAWWHGALVLAGGVLLLLAHRLYRRGLKRHMLRACEGCPELAGRGSHCSGFREPMLAMSALEEELTERHRAAQTIPPAVQRAIERQQETLSPKS